MIIKLSPYSVKSYRHFESVCKANESETFDGRKCTLARLRAVVTTPAESLRDKLESEQPDLLLQAIADVAKPWGMAQLARNTGLGHQSLYKAQAPGAKPHYDKALKLIRALGVELHMTPALRKT